MHQKTILTTMLLAILVVTCAIGYCQSDNAKNAKDKEQESYEQKKVLKASIKKNQTQKDILIIMGEPEEIEVLQKGPGITEIWYYDGRDVKIEFKNNLVATWFLRFMPDKPPKEKQKAPKEKCSLCEQDKNKNKSKENK